MGTISVGTIQVEVTRARDILVGVAWWELSQHCLTLLRFSFGKFNMFKIKSKLFRTNKKMQQRFCSPHTFHGPGSCVLIGIWVIMRSWILRPPQKVLDSGIFQSPGSSNQHVLVWNSLLHITYSLFLYSLFLLFNIFSKCIRSNRPLLF